MSDGYSKRVPKPISRSRRWTSFVGVPARGRAVRGLQEEGNPGLVCERPGQKGNAGNVLSTSASSLFTSGPFFLPPGHNPELRPVVLPRPCHHAIVHFGYFVGIHEPSAAHLNDLEDIPTLRNELPKLRFVEGLSLPRHDVEVLLSDLVCIDVARVLARSLLYGKQSVKGVNVRSLGGHDPSRISSGG